MLKTMDTEDSNIEMSIAGILNFIENTAWEEFEWSLQFNSTNWNFIRSIRMRAAHIVRNK